MPSHETKACSVVRLTEREDMTTDYGIRFAQSAVNNSSKDNMVLVWSAIPCTGGSPLQNINKRFLVGKKESKNIRRCSKLCGRHLLALLVGSMKLGRHGEFVLSGQGIVPTGTGRRFTLSYLSGTYKRFVFIGVRWV